MGDEQNGHEGAVEQEVAAGEQVADQADGATGEAAAEGEKPADEA